MEDWGKLIGDIPAAAAILDRFLHHAEVIEITGKSYRDPNRGKQPPKTDPKKGMIPKSSQSCFKLTANKAVSL